MMSQITFDYALIEWNDAVEADVINDLTSEHCIQFAAGFVVKKTKNYVVIARDYNTINDEYERVLRIPTKYILNYHTLA